MESRVFPILRMNADRTKVFGGGPIDHWDEYERSALVSVVIVQAQATGVAMPVPPPPPEDPDPTVRLVIAAGGSGRIAPNANAWAAEAHVKGAGSFVDGAAVAYAHGLIEYGVGALKPYDWLVHVVLELEP